ncbi:hypothetical protein BN946_scf184983.g52 [Trametes cinnabarina]|uniref:Uncharacterized protein n=1 Tax=Pycnoporus cinnabarinus TaxID=5643 RepID=A0A060SK05_PYCCI|nr:hypothetical protein BN946_scf184983.g52 [Trametes cinnabarina]
MHERCEDERTPSTEWFADLDYSPEGNLLITKKHDPVPLCVVQDKVKRLLEEQKITTVSGQLPLPAGVTELSICCHSDIQGTVKIEKTVKAFVDTNNAQWA